MLECVEITNLFYLAVTRGIHFMLYTKLFYFINLEHPFFVKCLIKDFINSLGSVFTIHFQKSALTRDQRDEAYLIGESVFFFSLKISHELLAIYEYPELV